MKKPLRVIFDLDDTLYPERAFALSGFRAAAAWAASEWGIADMAAEMASLLDDGHLGAVFKLALARHRPEYSDEDLARLVDADRNHEPTLALFDDAPAALERSAKYGRKERWWPGAESNHRHADFQSHALVRKISLTQGLAVPANFPK
jgi:FMN phosphatase YigB (HAD superfamily)